MRGRRVHAKMQAEGQICASCKAFIGLEATPAWGGLLCAKCSGRSHRVYMQFHLHGRGWIVNFLEEGLERGVCRPKIFASSDKILQTAERAGALRTLADRQALEHGIHEGRGGIYLTLTPEHYTKLRT